MNKSQSAYYKSLLLKTLLALTLLLGVSYGSGSVNLEKQPFHSETSFLKSNSSKKKAISYKRALELGTFNIEESKPLYSLHFITFHNAAAKVKWVEKHRHYCSFKSKMQFFSPQAISRNSGENTPIS